MAKAEFGRQEGGVGLGQTLRRQESLATASGAGLVVARPHKPRRGIRRAEGRRCEHPHHCAAGTAPIAGCRRPHGRGARSLPIPIPRSAARWRSPSVTRMPPRRIRSGLSSPPNIRPGDRWALEALGIGADLHWDARLAAVKSPHAEIIWRSRASASAELITKLLLASKGDEAAKYLRALQFQTDKSAVNKAFALVFQKGDQESALIAANQLGSEAIGALPGGPERLEQLIAPVRGKAEFVALVARSTCAGSAKSCSSSSSTTRMPASPPRRPS